MDMNFTEYKNEYEKVQVEQYPTHVPEKPLVSVCVQTYQHVNYIKACLEGIMMQETDFPYEVLLGEDASTDGTREFCVEYAERYPEKICLFLHKRENNIKIGGQPTGRFNFLYNLYNARGKYIALCEGDDYWTDPLKLQKQVDFLELNEEFVVAHHDAEVIDKQGNTLKESHLGSNIEEVYEQSDLMKGAGMVTCSMVFRNIFLEEKIPPEFYYAFGGDRFLTTMLGLKGKAYLMDDVGKAKYRIHQGGTDGNYTMDDSLENELKKMENYLATRIAMYLYLRRKGKSERYGILLQDILPKIMHIYKKKIGTDYLFDRIKKKLHL